MEDPNQPQRNYSLRRVFVIVESKCDLAASCDGIQIDKSMFVDWNLRNCQKKGTMHKMQKMQKMQKKQSEETIKGSQSRLKCQHWLGFHAAASAFPTVFEFLHRILVRNFVAHFFFCFESNKSQMVLK